MLLTTHVGMVAIVAVLLPKIRRMGLARDSEMSLDLSPLTRDEGAISSAVYFEAQPGGI